MADSVLKLCAICQRAPVAGVKPSRLAHAKAKYCTACRAERRQRPASTLTPEQGAEVARLTGSMTRDALAAQLGVSRAAVTRYVREHGLYGRSDQYQPDVVAAVLVAYEAAPKGRGKARVQDQFPDVCIRSIVERYKHFKPRQIRWTAAQILEAARMAGLVSRAAQSRYFGRPHANDGSVKALWVKRFQCAPHDINGLAAHAVWPLCGAGTPAVLVKYQTHGTAQSAPMSRVLWIELVRYVKPDVPADIREAIEVLADFQRWLHDRATSDAIATMIREREAYGDDASPREYERA